jgi:hypothetical protein
MSRRASQDRQRPAPRLADHDRSQNRRPAARSGIPYRQQTDILNSADELDATRHTPGLQRGATRGVKPRGLAGNNVPTRVQNEDKDAGRGRSRRRRRYIIPRPWVRVPPAPLLCSLRAACWRRLSRRRASPAGRASHVADNDLGVGQNGMSVGAAQVCCFSNHGYAMAL